jgi:hypothetical protein
MVSDNWTDVLYTALVAQDKFLVGYITTGLFFVFVFVLTHCASWNLD